MSILQWFFRTAWKECASAARFLQFPPSARKIVFYAEGRKDYPCWGDLIQALLTHSDLMVFYLTSDPEDPILATTNERIRPFYLKHLLPWVLSSLEANVLVMTMPDLHRYTLRRSRRVAHHLYLFHALCSTHMIYRFGAFDHYDTIFCAGPHQMEEIRRAESLYGLKPKQLVKVGYPRLDQLIRNHPNGRSPSHPGGQKILIAPSWGRANILETCVEVLAETLAQNGFQIVVRPHPESVKRHPRRISELARRFSAEGLIELELDPLRERSLHEAEVLITDWSGIALEYAFATERPVLFIDVPPKINNPRYAELGIVPLEVRLRSVIGETIAPEALRTAPEMARSLIQNRAAYRERILNARQESTFHLSRSGEVGARVILDLLHESS